MAATLNARWAPRMRNALKHVASALVVVALLIGGFFGSHLLAPGHSGEMEGEGESAAADLPTTVTLSEQKMIGADIHTTPVAYRDVQEVETVAATIEYDNTRRLSLRAPVDCVVDDLLVKPGKVVSQGERLVKLSSSEIALARTEVRKAEADVRLAEIQHDWTKETHDNLVDLLDALRQEPDVEELESQFTDASLGAFRDALLTSYAQFKLARNVVNRIKPLDEKGFLPGRTVDERTNARDIASTNFKTACEKAGFESRRALARSEAELDLARQQLAVAEEKLRLAQGPFAEADGDVPSDFEVRAPFAGRIESLSVSKGRRLAHDEVLLELADTSVLWVSAMVHQHDWEALALAPDETVHVRVPALPDASFDARVSFVGAEVSAETRAASLVAEIDNSAGRFRPGMFAWVSLPMEPSRQSLAVSPAAIQRHESELFVFVEEGERQFRRVNVVAGLETPEYVEIVEGLTAGQKVVDGGAFYLKSELLLEREEE